MLSFIREFVFFVCTGGDFPMLSCAEDVNMHLVVFVLHFRGSSCVHFWYSCTIVCTSTRVCTQLAGSLTESRRDTPEEEYSRQGPSCSAQHTHGQARNGPCTDCCLFCVYALSSCHLGVWYALSKQPFGTSTKIQKRRTSGLNFVRVIVSDTDFLCPA